MYRVLIIEDDEMLNDGLCYNLQKAGMDPIPAYSLESAKDCMSSNKFDLIILDVNLPDGNGFQFAKEIFSQHEIPFIFLTAHILDEEIINGFQIGADDYITKPFSVKILTERVQAVLRRCSDKTDDFVYSCGNLTIDFKDRTVSKEGTAVSLTPTEFDLLQLFCKNKDRILTKDILLEHIWDRKGNYVNDHTLTINISRLRNKIADERYGYIKTIYGMGYKWIEHEDD